MRNHEDIRELDPGRDRSPREREFHRRRQDEPRKLRRIRFWDNRSAPDRMGIRLGLEDRWVRDEGLTGRYASNERDQDLDGPADFLMDRPHRSHDIDPQEKPRWSS